MLNHDQAGIVSLSQCTSAKESRVNSLMRKRRRALGWTQFDLAQLSGIDVGDIQALERFRYVPGKLEIVNDKLIRVAQALEMDFDQLFPLEYLHVLERMKYPHAYETFRWMREIHLDELPKKEPTEDLIDHSIEHVEHLVNRWALVQTIDELLNEVPPRERLIIEKRFGLGDGDAKTRSQIGQYLGMSGERIRQIEIRAMKRLRHPIRSKRLSAFRELL